MTGGSGQEGGLWRPANAEELDALAASWCRHCLNRYGDGNWEDEFGNEIAGECSIRQVCDNALFFELPSDLVIRHGMPWCKAFRQDPDRPARCLFTKEMEV